MLKSEFTVSFESSLGFRASYLPHSFACMAFGDIKHSSELSIKGISMEIFVEKINVEKN
jgi:hypothetical protein